LRIALDHAKEKLTGDVYIIPVLLDDDLPYPDELRQLHFVHASDPNAESAIADAITQQVSLLFGQSEAAQEESGISWTQMRGQESWDGLPGYNVEWSQYFLSSSKYPAVDDINAVIAGRIAQIKMSARKAKLSQSPTIHNFGESPSLRTNTIDAQFSPPVVTGRILSIICASHYYFSGAAHGNTAFETHVFLLNPLVQFSEIKDIFSKETEALVILQKETRRLLLECGDPDGDDAYRLDAEWIARGTSDWISFETFRLVPAGLELTFAPYEVAAYAFGPQSVTVPYRFLVDVMSDDVAAALGIKYLKGGDPPWLIDEEKAVGGS